MEESNTAIGAKVEHVEQGITLENAPLLSCETSLDTLSWHSMLFHRLQESVIVVTDHFPQTNH